MDVALKALLDVSKDTNLSKQIVDVSEKLIYNQFDEDIGWLYEMHLNDVKTASYTTILLISSLALTVFIYFFLLLFRYGQKFDE